MQEYAREFTRLLSWVPFAATDEARKVYLDEKGSRMKIFTSVPAQRLQTLDASIEQTLWDKRRASAISERATVTGQSQDRKRPTLEDGG